ncbi:MAG: LacI family DNA-binding transcriptional regulator [Acetobacteraceae bacterium]
MTDEPRQQARAHRPGLREVAESAGVSLATVDRVLNERGSASAETARRVIEAARRLGLRRTLPLPYRRTLRLEVVLERSETSFFVRFTQAIRQVAGTLDRGVIIARTLLEEGRTRGMAARIRASEADGLILYAAEHPEIAAAITDRAGRGPVVCVVTDMPGTPRLAYVGIDHERAGRTAGLFAARLTGGQGSALVLANRLAFQAHQARVEGFRAALAQYGPGMAVAEVIEGRDDKARTAALLRAGLRRHPAISALYHTGGWNREVGAALVEAGLAGRIVFIGHELTAAATEMLRAGTMSLAIDQAPELQARRAIEALLKHLGALPPDATPNEIPFTLHSAENC